MHYGIYNIISIWRWETEDLEAGGRRLVGRLLTMSPMNNAESLDLFTLLCRPQWVSVLPSLYVSLTGTAPELHFLPGFKFLEVSKPINKQSLNSLLSSSKGQDYRCPIFLSWIQHKVFTRDSTISNCLRECRWIFPAFPETKFTELSYQRHLKLNCICTWSHHFYLLTKSDDFFFLRKNVFNYYVAFLFCKTTCCLKLLVTFKII